MKASASRPEDRCSRGWPGRRWRPWPRSSQPEFACGITTRRRRSPLARRSIPATPIVAKAVPVPKVRFTDITQQAGIHFTHTNGAFGKRLLPETMGSGVAFIDYDNDDKPDLLFVNSCYWPGYEKAGAAPTLALYHNLGGGKFEDVTAASGLAVTMYGMGVTVGDYDNDGWPDVFITGVGGNRLFHNEPAPGGGRRFRDVTAEAGVGGPGGWPKASDGDFLSRKAPLPFCTSASFLDYDGDGLLDLFVCSYVTWSPDYDLHANFNVAGAGAVSARRPPLRALSVSFITTSAAVSSRTFRPRPAFRCTTRKAWTPTAATFRRQVARRHRRRRGRRRLSRCDRVERDRAQLFLSQHPSARTAARMFEEIGYKCGVGYAEGRRVGRWASIGLGIIVPGLMPPPSATLRTNRTLFCAWTTPSACDSPTTLWPRASAGRVGRCSSSACCSSITTSMAGADLFTCNGHVEPEIEKISKGQKYQQPAQLFWNTGKQPGGFEPVPAERPALICSSPVVGRGCAFADIDGDGAFDLVLTGNGEPARLLHNDGGTGHHWVRLDLLGDGVHSNRTAIGARITVEAGGVKQVRRDRRRARLPQRQRVDGDVWPRRRDEDRPHNDPLAGSRRRNAAGVDGPGGREGPHGRSGVSEGCSLAQLFGPEMKPGLPKSLRLHRLDQVAVEAGLLRAAAVFVLAPARMRDEHHVPPLRVLATGTGFSEHWLASTG